MPDFSLENLITHLLTREQQEQVSVRMQALTTALLAVIREHEPHTDEWSLLIATLATRQLADAFAQQYVKVLNQDSA